jgi:hypothetical protein
VPRKVSRQLSVLNPNPCERGGCAQATATLSLKIQTGPSCFPPGMGITPLLLSSSPDSDKRGADPMMGARSRSL